MVFWKKIRSLDLYLSLTQEISDIYVCFVSYLSLEITIVCLNMGDSMPFTIYWII